MGRPISDKSLINFGCQYNYGTEVDQYSSYAVVKQESSVEFLLGAYHSQRTSLRTPPLYTPYYKGILTPVEGPDLLPGQMNIALNTSTNTRLFAVKFLGTKVFASDGNVYKWYSTADGSTQTPTDPDTVWVWSWEQYC